MTPAEKGILLKIIGSQRLIGKFDWLNCGWPDCQPVELAAEKSKREIEM